MSKKSFSLLCISHLRRFQLLDRCRRGPLRGGSLCSLPCIGFPPPCVGVSELRAGLLRRCCRRTCSFGCPDPRDVSCTLPYSPLSPPPTPGRAEPLSCGRSPTPGHLPRGHAG